VQYWIPKALAVSALVSLSGCSIFIDEAHSERNYRTHESVKVPANLEKPAEDPIYKMDIAKYSNNPEASNYRPPAQVLTIATGSWVEENDKQARVYFDKNDGIENLETFIWNAVNLTLTENKTQSTEFNEADKTLTTDWYAIVTPESGWWWWSDEEKPDLERFKFFIEEKSHQRTASLRAELIDFQSDENELTDLLKQQLEVGALNQVIKEFDFLYRQLELNMRQGQGALAFSPGFDSKGNAALITAHEYETVFDSFSSILERLSFTIVEINQETGLVIADYKKPEVSMWDSIWGDEVYELAIDEGQYQVSLSKTDDNGTSFTWMNDEGDVLSPDVITVLQKGLQDIQVKPLLESESGYEYVPKTKRKPKQKPQR
jgi:outer membrane protein assembly factor BamC